MSDKNYNVLDFRNEGGGIIKCWTKHVNVEKEAIEQMKLASMLPFIDKHIALMPDCHHGIGCTVGSVIPTKKAIVPSFCGVDIGCGMIAVQLSLTSHDIPETTKELRKAIESKIPHGVSSEHRDHVKGGWESIPNNVKKTWSHRLYEDFVKLTDKHKHLKQRERAAAQLGTLGGGNHFVELCLDTEDNVWVMLHSGSRGIGNMIGTHFIELAKKEMEKHFIHLPDKNLSYLVEGTQHFNDYWDALTWCQDYAKWNREMMLENALIAIRKIITKPFNFVNKAVNCHHNYTSLENFRGENLYITRKGAIRARKDELGIIPGSMGDKSYIVRGLGNEESWNSCSHGAGRLMSRTKAKELISLDDHIKATEGVECRKDEGVIDESPKAYKRIEDVMKSQMDLVEIVATLKQFLCIKG